MAAQLDCLWANDSDNGEALHILFGLPIKEVGRFYIDEDGDLAFEGKIKDAIKVILRQPLCAIRGIRRLDRKRL